MLTGRTDQRAGQQHWKRLSAGNVCHGESTNLRPLRQGAEVSEAHIKWGAMPIRDIIARMRHDGCGGLAGKAELLTGIEGASSRPVPRIVLVDG